MHNNWQNYQKTKLAKLVSYNRLGLITDVDGTISPIVERPDDAYVTPRNIELLTALIDQLPLVAAVSGRSAADIHNRVGVAGLEYIGNHGLERWQDGQVVVMPAVASYRPNLEAAKAAVQHHQVEGLWVEDKQATLTVHYRQTADPETFATEFRPLLQEIAAENDIRLFEGRMIFELRPPIDAHKGTALQTLVEEYQLEAAVFLGDDVTDVDAMQVGQTLRESGQCYVLNLGVSGIDTPASVLETADMFIDGVAGTESFLAWLLKARSASAT